MERRYYSNELWPLDPDALAGSRTRGRDEPRSEDVHVIPDRDDSRRSAGELPEPGVRPVQVDLREPGDDDKRNEEPDLRRPSRERRLMEKKKFIRYSEGAALYSMNRRTFARMAVEAHAVYKIDRLCLVNTEVFEEYLETFRV